MSYYKATRPDGGAFHDPSVVYAPGRRVRPKRSDVRWMCGPGYLHAADVATETLVGGTWPCRLFVVEGTPAMGFDRRHPHKGAFRQLRVVEEIGAWRALGPQGREVAALIERAGALTDDEARRRGHSAGAARNASWDAARHAAMDAALGTAWHAARGAALSAARRAAGHSAGGAAMGAAGVAAYHAAGDAAVALVVRDLLNPVHFDTLYGPWRKVIGS